MQNLDHQLENAWWMSAEWTAAHTQVALQLMRIIRRRLPLPPDWDEDIIQDIALRYPNAIRSWRGTNPRGWLYTLLHNRAVEVHGKEYYIRGHTRKEDKPKYFVEFNDELTFRGSINTPNPTAAEEESQQPIVADWAVVQNEFHDVLPQNNASDDSGEPMLQFLRGESRVGSSFEHFLVCRYCQTTLYIVRDQLLDFVVAASDRPITEHNVSLIKRLKVQAGAVQLLLDCWQSDGADEAIRNWLEHNLRLLGYRKSLQNWGGRSRPRSSRQVQHRNDFLTMWALVSTLAALLRWEDVTDGKHPFSMPIVTIRLADTFSNDFATGALVRLCRRCRVQFIENRPVQSRP